MKHLLLSACLAVLPFGTLAPTAVAQLAVYDPANHVQNIFQAARTLQQVNAQIEQITNELEMLQNMARDLEQLPDSIRHQILARIDELTRAILEAEGIGYRVEEIEREYEDLYPEDYETPPEHRVLVEQARDAWRQSRAGYRDSLVTQARIVQSVANDLPELERILELSSGAQGNLSAIQAGNELTALGIKQDMQLQQLMAAQYRAEALRRAEEAAVEARARARFESFMGDGDAYSGGDW
jgi:P-type conjugative transfer protein TrbJ